VLGADLAEARQAREIEQRIFVVDALIG